MNLFKSFRRFYNCITKHLGLLLCLNFCFAHWVDYNLDVEVYSQPDVRRFVEGAAFTISEIPSNLLSPDNRIHISVGLSKRLWSQNGIYQRQLSRMAPKFSAALFLTHNLTFIGGISQFHSDKQNIQIQSYGLALRTNEDTSYPLQTSAVFCRLAGPKDLNQRTVSLNLSSKLNIMGFEFQYGIGKEMYSATFLIDDSDFPSEMKGEINYFLIGMLIKNNKYGFISQLRLHPDLIGISLRVSLGID